MTPERYPRGVCLLSAVLIGVGVSMGSGSVLATTITDPPNDFLASFVGPHNGDLDVLTATATIDSSALHLAGSLNGLTGTTSGTIYVFGIDRGTNNAPFGPFNPGVLFDAVVIVAANGTATVRDLLTNVATPLPTSEVMIGSSSIAADVPLSLLPTEGFTFDQYLVNLWPRTGLDNNNQIADFAPDSTDFRVSRIPEPGAVLALGAGLLCLGLLRRRRMA